MSLGYAQIAANRRVRQMMVMIFALVDILLTGCAHPEHAGIADLLSRIERADSNEDLPGVLSCYSDDIVWIPPDGSVVRGIDSIRNRYQQLFAENDLTVANRAEGIKEGAGVASVSGLTHVSRTPRAGGPRLTSRDRFIMLVRDSASGWRVHMLGWWPEEVGGK